MAPTPKHILIVEDSTDLQTLLVQLFEGEGYRLSRAFNGQEALDLLKTMTDLPSVILLDIMMPVMDGIEFRERQRRDPKLSLIPVVVMTADSNPQTKAQRLGVTHVLKKPITDLEYLLDVVAKHAVNS